MQSPNCLFSHNRWAYESYLLRFGLCISCTFSFSVFVFPLGGRKHQNRGEKNLHNNIISQSLRYLTVNEISLCEVDMLE